MTRGDVRVTGPELSGRTVENTLSTATCLDQHLHLCHSESQEYMPSVIASIRRREHGAKVGGADNLRLERTSAKETKTSHTEGGWWHGCRRAQVAEAHDLLRGIDSSPGCAAKRARHQNLVRRRVRHQHRPKPAERSGGGKTQTQAYNDVVQQKGRGHGLQPPFIWAWAGLVQGLITEGTKLGEVLAPFSDHTEELNKLSIEERCGMVKHCRIDKTFQPQQCRVTLAVETLHLRCAVEKALEAFSGERTQGQGPRTALSRELKGWLVK